MKKFQVFGRVQIHQVCTRWLGSDASPWCSFVEMRMLSLPRKHKVEQMALVVSRFRNGLG